MFFKNFQEDVASLYCASSEDAYLPDSVRQNAANCSPVASLGKYFAFCSSVPCIRIPCNRMHK